MKNAEWMIKNKIDFLRLSCSRNEAVNINQHGYTFNIMLYDKKVSTIYANDASVTNAVLAWLDMEHKEPILDEAEKKYLSAVIKPFRDDVKDIIKIESIYRLPDDGSEYIKICMCSDEEINLPYFRYGTMYKGMEVGRRYTLDELGL